MTHLGFIAVSYALGIGIPVLFGIGAAQRLAAARRRLAAIDPRGRLAATDPRAAR